MTDQPNDTSRDLAGLADRVLAVQQALQLHDQQLNRQERDLADHRDAIIAQGQAAIDNSNVVMELNEHVAARYEQLVGQLGQLVGQLAAARNDVDRMMPQVESLERRLEGLRADFERRAGGVEPSSPQYAEQVLAEARREHELARLKLELASHYEERLRRLERAAEVTVGAS